MIGKIFDIKRFAIHDGPGIRTTVFFKECPLRCWWCHNPEAIYENLISEETADNRILSNDLKIFELNADELLHEIKKDLIFFEESGGGVTFSGGEPLAQMDFLLEILIRCKSEGIHTAIDTSGYAPFEFFVKIYEFVDIFLFDLKIANDVEHIAFTGVSNSLIFDNLKKLTRLGEKIIIRIPLIPDYTDTNSNLKRLIDIINLQPNIKRIDLLPYNEFADSKYSRLNLKKKTNNLSTQSKEKLDEIISIFNNAGLTVNFRG
ncbi:MAG: glycyl-radical enzyme activating protein [bacterium]